MLSILNFIFQVGVFKFGFVRGTEVETDAKNSAEHLQTTTAGQKKNRNNRCKYQYNVDQQNPISCYKTHLI